MLDQALRRIRQQQRKNPGLPKKLKAEIKKVEQEVDRLVALVAEGGEAPERVRAEIDRREECLKVLRDRPAEIETVVALPRLAFDQRRTRRELKERLDELHGLMRANPRRPARRCGSPWRAPGSSRGRKGEDGGSRGYAIRGQARIGPLLARTTLASPTGFEPVLPP